MMIDSILARRAAFDAKHFNGQPDAAGAAGDTWCPKE